MKCDNFWDASFRDNTDLAVIVAGDMCERRIDIRDYLKYQESLDLLTIIRQCLLLGADIKRLDIMTSGELIEYREELLHKKFEFYTLYDVNKRNYLLQIIQHPFARWGPGCLCVEYSSVDLLNKMDIKEIADMVTKELEFKYFTPSKLCDQRIFKIQQP